MKTTVKASFAVLVLLLAMSCQKQNSVPVSAGINEERTIQTDVAAESLTINTVRIGKQIWQKKDLATSYYRNGDRIPEVKDASKWASLTTGAWCYYNNDPRNGKLYNWYGSKRPQRIGAGRLACAQR